MEGTSDSRSSSLQLQVGEMENVTDEIMKKNEFCSICLEKFIKDEKILKTPCSHFFHELCIREWLKISKSCPVCRTELVSPENLRERSVPRQLSPNRFFRRRSRRYRRRSFRGVSRNRSMQRSLSRSNESESD